MRSRRSPILWVGAVAYGTAIFVLSSLPVPAPGEQALALTGDKVLHVAEYAGFALLLTLAIASTPSLRISSRAAVVGFIAATLYAALDEFHQTLVPGRRGDATDFAADAAGALLGAGVVHLWRWRAARAVSGTSPR
jgi:VanZ family protein